MADHIIDRGGSPDGTLRVELFQFYGEQTVTVDQVDGDTAAHLTADQARAVARDLIDHADRLDGEAEFVGDGYGTYRYRITARSDGEANDG